MFNYSFGLLGSESAMVCGIHFFSSSAACICQFFNDNVVIWLVVRGILIFFLKFLLFGIIATDELVKHENVVGKI